MCINTEEGNAPIAEEIVFSDYNILSNLYELAPIRLAIFRKDSLLLSATATASDNFQTENDLVFLIDTKKQDGFLSAGRI
jgi:hypothetical protein